MVNRSLTIGAILSASPSSIIAGKITEESVQAIVGAQIKDRNIAGSWTGQSIGRVIKLEETRAIAEEIRLRPQML